MLDEASVDRLTAGLRLLAPAGVMVGARAISDADLSALHPVESAHVAGAVDKRRREYASGRALLRGLLAGDIAIPTADDRRPVPPEGWRISLAHDNEIAVAAAATTEQVRALGVDVEPVTPLDVAMATAILRPDEAGLDAHLGFTLKEAVYKAWSELGGRMLDHQEVRIDLGGEPGPEPAGFTGLVVADERGFDGRVVLVDQRWLALVVVGN